MGWPKKKIDQPKAVLEENKKPNLKLVNDSNQTVLDKAEIDRLRKILSEKIKDPKLAKKASMIIAEMLSKK